MNSREKLKKTLNHEDGPLVVDFGSTAVTGMHVNIIGQLRKHYGLEERPVKVCEPYQMLGEVEPDLAEVIGVDTIGVLPEKTIFGFKLGDWKPWKAPWGQELLVPSSFNVTEDDNGCYIYPEGDTSVPASGHMPKTGYFFDSIVRQEPIDEDKLDPADNLEEFGLLEGSSLDFYRQGFEEAAKTGLGVVGSFPGTGLGDIALVPAPFLKRPRGIRDIAEWYMSTAMRRDYVRAVFEKQTEYALQNLAAVHAKIGDNADVFVICGTDFGTQGGTFCSVDTYNDLWKPYYSKMNNWIHENTSWKTFKHSCGSVIDFVEPFIESGFDILNPVQCSAAGMDPQTLKDKFGDQIVFWGGGVDTQKTLPFGTPDEVKKEVLERCRIFSKKGGFIFNAIHNVQANTPVQNVVAMIEALNEFRGQ